MKSPRLVRFPVTRAALAVLARAAWAADPVGFNFMDPADNAPANPAYRFDRAVFQESLCS